MVTRCEVATLGVLLILVWMSVSGWFTPELRECHRDDQCTAVPSRLGFYFEGSRIWCVEDGIVSFKLVDPPIEERLYLFPVASRMRTTRGVVSFEYARLYLQPENETRIFCAGMNLTCDVPWCRGRFMILGRAWPPTCS